MSEIPVSELQTLEPSSVIELYELDATSLGGDVLYFHAGTNELSQNIVWNGQTYVRYPVQVSGFEMSAEGAFPRPKLAVSNALSAISAVLMITDDLMGAKVTRKRTMKKFLDAENFTGGVNPDEDPTAEFPSDVYFIDRKSHEDGDTVEFELASSIDLAGVRLPRRQIIQNVCVWKYRSSECGYTGPPLYDLNDQLIPSATSMSAEAQAVLDLKAQIEPARIAIDEAENALTAATAAQGNACSYVFEHVDYDITTSSGVVTFFDIGVMVNEVTGEVTAKWDGDLVTLGIDYRQATLHHRELIKHASHLPPQMTAFYNMELWSVYGAGCSAATATAAAALVARDAAQAAYDGLLEDYDDAVTALPEDDAVYSMDRCGKRLGSCELRFGENEPLPFGSFPSASLVR